MKINIKVNLISERHNHHEIEELQSYSEIDETQLNVRLGSLTDILRRLNLRPLYPRKRTSPGEAQRVRCVTLTETRQITYCWEVG